MGDNRSEGNAAPRAHPVVTVIVHLRWRGKAGNEDSLGHLPSKPQGDFAHNEIIYQNPFSPCLFIYLFIFLTWAGKRSSPAHKTTLKP